MKERRHLARFYHAAMFGCHAWNAFIYNLDLQLKEDGRRDWYLQ